MHREPLQRRGQRSGAEDTIAVAAESSQTRLYFGCLYMLIYCITGSVSSIFWRAESLFMPLRQHHSEALPF